MSGTCANAGVARAERLIEQHLLRRVRHVIVAADHMRDRHVDVVHDHGEVIRGMAVGAQDDEALDVLVGERNGAVHEIGEGRLPLGHLESDRALVAERAALCQETFGRRSILVEPLRLEVGRVRPIHLRAFVPIETKPAQAVEDAGDHFVRRALDIGVFDAEDEHTTMAPDVQPVEERRAGAADVQVAGRGRSEAKARRGHATLKVYRVRAISRKVRRAAAGSAAAGVAAAGERRQRT